MARLLVIWMAAVVLLIYVAAGIAARRTSQAWTDARNLRTFRKLHHFDASLGKWVRNVDGVVLSEARTILHWGKLAAAPIIFLLWEGFWLFEVASTSRPSEISPLYLFLVMFVVPFAVYALFHRDAE